MKYKIKENEIKELLEQNWKIIAENAQIIVLKKGTKKLYFTK